MTVKRLISLLHKIQNKNAEVKLTTTKIENGRRIDFNSEIKEIYPFLHDDGRELIEVCCIEHHNVERIDYETGLQSLIKSFTIGQ